MDQFLVNHFVNLSDLRAYLAGDQPKDTISTCSSAVLSLPIFSILI